jgi:hypothetical protein
LQIVHWQIDLHWQWAFTFTDTRGAPLLVPGWQFGYKYPISDGYGYEDDFLSVGGTRTRPESRWIRDEYFFTPTANPTGIRYFTTAIIIGCEQVKMCSFYYINYILFWLLNFATRLSKNIYWILIVNMCILWFTH